MFEDLHNTTVSKLKILCKNRSLKIPYKSKKKDIVNILRTHMLEEYINKVIDSL